MKIQKKVLGSTKSEIKTISPDERLELSTLGLKGPRANQLCLKHF